LRAFTLGKFSKSQLSSSLLKALEEGKINIDLPAIEEGQK